MKRVNTISSIKALVYINLMELKNNIKQMFTHSARIIGAVFKVVVPMIAIVRLPFMLNSIDGKEKLLSFNMPANIIGAIVMLLLLAVFFINLKKAVENYYPTQYSAADVNFLFTSPISSRLIYAWSITKQIFNALLGSAFMMIPVFSMLEASNSMASDSALIYAFAGIVLFIIIVQTLKFFLYSISKRFNIAALVKTLVLISLGAVAIYFIISLYGSVDILQRAIEVLDGKNFDSIPVIGWIKKLVLSPFSGSVPFGNLIVLASFAALMLFITIYFATDYYEEAIVSTERMTKIRAASTRNNMEEIQQLISEKKVKVKNVYVHWNLRKAYAFLWKAIVVNRRKSRGTIAEVAKYLIFLAVGGVFGYVFRNHTYKELIVFIVVLGMIFKNANSSFLEGFEYELKKNYIFLLPGRVSDKILAINIIPAIKTLVRNFMIIFSMALFLKVNVFQLSSLWVVLSATNLMSLFTVAAIKVIIPFGDRKNILLIYLRNIVEIILVLPAVGVGVLIYYLFNNMVAALFVFGICSLLIVMGLLYVSEALFSRLELNH